ncbi:hypothetical protein LEMLEM_LOCUS21506 [Lemmus lemmus]
MLRKGNSGRKLQSPFYKCSTRKQDILTVSEDFHQEIQWGFYSIAFSPS